MPKATIQGELHGSQGDKQRLLNHGLESYDQLFIEGRAAIDIRGVSTKFAAFLIGTVTAFWIEGFIAKLARSWTLYFSNTVSDIDEAARDAGLSVDDEIDSGLDEIYEGFEGGRSGYLLSAVMVILFLFSLGSLMDLILFNISRGGPTNFVSLVIISIHVFAFVLMTSAFFFTGLIIFRTSNLEDRDQTMANSIIERCETNEFDRVLISCGDKHVPGIKRELQNEGWEVDPSRSGHWLSRLLRVIRS